MLVMYAWQWSFLQLFCHVEADEVVVGMCLS